MEALQVGMKMRQGEWADDVKVIVGDFTYAWQPRIKSWGEDAKLYIGKFCSIAGNVQFFLGGDHRLDWVTTYPFAELMPKNYPDVKGSPRSKGDIVIGNDVWIANDAKIMSGVHIGDGAVIAGSAVVTKDVQPYEMVGGVPAKHIKWRLPIGQCQRMQELAWWDWPLDKIAEAVPLLQSDNYNELYLFNEEWRAKHG
jgi:acetyltransferase-like isoleucine patch superfamily enzyme